MEGSDNQERPSHADKVGEPEGEGKRHEQRQRDDEETENDCQGGTRNQVYHLVNHIELDVFCLQP